MALYFADHGWQDILVAFPANWLQIDKINMLANKIKLGLLVESVETVEFLSAKLTATADVYLKIDTGYHRTGILWDDSPRIEGVAEALQKAPKLTLKGMHTHPGHSYRAEGIEAVKNIYQETVQREHRVRSQLDSMGFQDIALSIGDTPSCSLIDDFSAIHEIRPGNFVFYDWMQVEIGSCKVEDIAVLVACPVVAKHDDRNTIIVYGGAVHFSKELLAGAADQPLYGMIADGWGQIIPDTWFASLSQEHGVIKASPEFFSRVQVGDVLMIYPIHSCLTVDLLKKYQTVSGEEISMGSW
jgi:D-serine deaminase-like pyridoxal phosphate-dependent protein